MTAFGTLALGTSPFGGPGLITVLAVLPLSANTALVVFDREPLALDNEDPHDATNPAVYGVAAVDPTYTSETTPAPGIVPVGAAVPTRNPQVATATVDDADPKQIVLAFDADLEKGISYDVDISAAICGADDETMAGPLVWRFTPPNPEKIRSPATISEEKYRDFDYVLNPEFGASGGVLRIDAQNDIGIQDADASLRKRIFRRIFSGRGAFAFLRNYGAGKSLKRLTRPGDIQELISDAAAQIREEPDVVSATVDAAVERRPEGTFLLVNAYVTRHDSRTVRFSFREPIVSR